MLVGLRVVRKNRVDSIRLVMMIWNVLHSKHGISLWPVYLKESRVSARHDGMARSAVKHSWVARSEASSGGARCTALNMRT